MSYLGYALRVNGFGNITVGAASSSVDLTSLIPASGIGARVMLVASTTSYWNSGKTAPTVTSADKILPANVPVVFDLPPGHRFVAALQVAAGGFLTVYVLAN